MRRLSFYQKKTITDDNMDAPRRGQPLSKLGWYDFLVHTELCTMNYDGLGVDDDMKLNHMIRMMENLRVPQTLKKPAGEILPFVYDIKMVMRDNSYHNFTHVTDLAAAYIAAVCHDLDHPGLSNTYQNNENTELSKRYNKESPLENHHLSVFGRLCEKHELLANLPTEEERRASSTSCTT
ncbi:3',5'-cyclic-nucleotide phosphodiesterase [Aureococcus anophagefferens]|nr:3',5'-cyclic-nucleotide phosphodiesterase [Aureococcus anophagefferens]